jgi:ABC-type lipoprotein release transport system permease subunit
VTVAAMTLALTVMILYAGMMAGYLEGMERNILELEVGDLQIFPLEYRDDPSIYTRIANPEVILESLAAEGFNATARLLAYGMAAAGNASAGVSFRGIDIERDARVSLIHREVQSGRWLDRDDPRGVVLGSRLARMLDVDPGAELVVLTQAADGSMAYDLYRVRGVLRSVGDETDRTGVFMAQEALRELIAVPSGSHQIIVRRPAGANLEQSEARVRELVLQHDVKTWRQLLPTLASMMDSARGAIMAMFLIVYMAIGILILNATLMAVFERVREFGVLKAIGAGPFDVLRLIMLESGIQVGLAILLGVAISTPTLWFLTTTGLDLSSLAGVSVMGIAMDPIWRASVSPQVFSMPIVILFVIVITAAIYPALKAALIQPVEAMRHH